MRLASGGSAVGRTVAAWAASVAVLAAVLWPQASSAIPLFNRQTGQNCVACHAGGQFPELTPYGRLFKMTGYTLGERTLPVSAMAVATYSKVANTSKSDDPKTDFSKNESLIFATASLFLGGKVTDNIGAFAQVTYDPYVLGDDGSYHGHTNADNIDLRYADRFVDANRDLIVGVSVNNNPSVSDPWNTAAAWMQYVPVPSPTSYQFVDGNAPFPGYASDGNIAGITAYAFWNRMIYGELGLYRTSRGALSFMSAGVANADNTKLQGSNPYWRLAWNHEWGAHSLMLGTAGMVARIYDDPLDTSDPASLHHVRDWSVDAQYQYLLDPHALTAQVVYANRHETFPDALANQAVPFVDAAGNALAPTNAADTTRVFRAKLSYVYQAHYGGSLAYFNLSGSTDTALLSSGYDPGTLTITSDPTAGAPSTRVSGNFTGSPATRGTTYELFWTPLQYLRVGAQYTAYTRFNGASQNYDGLGRNARDNNTLFLYAWGAY
ncbi:MAG TPA: cytochrome C [Ideonella sp.]|nr:cytochrome C [Ideonella sp.]